MSPKVMQGNELTYAERQFLELRLLGKWSLRHIAEAMGRDHSVLSREARRNRRGGRYRAEEAQRAADARKRLPRKGRKLDRDPDLAGWVEARIRDGWSPEKVAGRLRSAGSPAFLRGKSVSHEAIYGWLYKGGGRFGGLSSCLWTKRKRRWSRKGKRPKTATIEGRVPISRRPEDGGPGDMESDSMIWMGWKGLLSAQVDREILVCRLRPCADRTGAETAQALRRAVETLPHRFVRSVAFDNGSENARHRDLSDGYGVATYFCDPHSPWQKPQVENLNRTIRHWLPRKTKVSSLTERDWKAIEDRLNNLPRKRLGYLTPNEALNQYLSGGAFRP